MNENEIIRMDAFMTAFPRSYHKTDTVKFRGPFRWRNGIVYPPSIGQNIIITGHSDYDINDSDVEYYRPRIWWCINKQTRNPIVHSIPLGIKNHDYQYAPENKEMGDKSLFIEMMNTEKPPPKNLVYMNFDVNTYPSERLEVFNMFKDKPYVTVEHRTEMRKYLTELRSHTFALCPRGNGVDTHRLWEALYMDCIPVVKRDIALEEFYDMPICFIDSWDEVNEEFLKIFERNLSVKNTEKLKMSYWIKRIKDTST